MSSLPSGTVTFLFTDIEGSTRLLHEFGKRYADVLAEHRRVLREAFARHGGVEVDTQGDAFFVAFQRATDAVAAAGEAQQALADGPVRVRIGIHTGEPVIANEGYFGIDVHRAARVMAAGHGGQVLVSQTTRELLEEALELRDLGEHRLKDLSAPQRLYQLGGGDFPPLKTLYQTNLPIQPTPLIGRERELVEARALLDDHRLLTLVGPGGTGKTRLALQLAAEAADDFPAGVWWVSLAALAETELVEPTIAQIVGAKDGLTEHLRSRRSLLLLDSFEHLLGAAPRIADVLREVPDVKVLVTSRASLRVRGEREYPVPPLAGDDAVALFTQRAQGLKPTFEPDEHVASICRRLDGLPLAIELAAARVTVLPPAKLLERLGRALPLLTGGARDAPERQRTLRATIEWSHELLDEEEKRLLAELGVFAGSFSLEAAEDVCRASLDTLQSLVEKNLLRQTDEGRFCMLETIREYALEQLAASGEAEDVRNRHAAHFARLADRRWADLIRGAPEWRQIVELERENLHTALERSLARRDAQSALAIGSGIWPFWLDAGFAREGRRWLEEALSLPTEQTGRRGDALAGFGNIAQFQGDLGVARAAIEEALALFRSIDEPQWVAAALSQLADVVLRQGDRARAVALAEESVALRRGRLGGFALGRGLASLAEIALADGDFTRAQALYEEALAIERADDPESVFVPEFLEALGEVARRSGDDAAALRLFGNAIRACAHRRDDRVVADSLAGIAAVYAVRGDGDKAARLAAAAERLRAESGLALRDRPLPERLEPAWSEGGAMTAGEAVHHALSAID